MAVADESEAVASMASGAIVAGLSRRGRWLYPSGYLGVEALTQSRNAWLLYCYAPPADADRVALLRISTVGLILFAGKLLEAFDDTLIGWWSDRTVGRLGRRIPFVLVGTPLMALFGFLLLIPPERGGELASALYLFITLELLFLFATLSNAPYDALLPEIAPTVEERVELSARRVYAGVLGAAIGLVGSGLLVAAFGFRVMAGVMALLAFGTRYLGLFGVWREARGSVSPTTVTLRDSVRLTLSNRELLRFLGSFVLFQAALTMVIGLLPFYVSGILRRNAEGIWAPLLTGVGIGAMALAIPVFARSARGASPMRGYRRAMLAAAAVFPLLAITGLVPGVPVEVEALVILVIVGAPLAGVFLFPGPIIAGLCDADAARTATRREGMFYGAQAFVEKVATSLAPLVLGLLLILGSSASHPLGIRLVGPVAALMVVGGYLIAGRVDAAPAVEPAMAWNVED